MTINDFDTRAAWRVDDLEADRGWEFNVDDKAREQMAQAIRKAFDPDRPLFDYTMEDFDLGPAWGTISAAIKEAYHGRGIALVHGLPRDGISEDYHPHHEAARRPLRRPSRMASPSRATAPQKPIRNGITKKYDKFTRHERTARHHGCTSIRGRDHPRLDHQHHLPRLGPDRRGRHVHRWARPSEMQAVRQIRDHFAAHLPLLPL